MFEDFRYAFRALRKDPGFAIPTVLALALSIGANTSVFTVVKSVLLAELPLYKPAELVALYSMRPDGQQYPFNIPNFLDLQQQNRVLLDAAAYGGFNANLTGEANPERILGTQVTGNFFPLMGVPAALGRTLTPDDDRPGRPKVVVLTWNLWQRRYGGDAGILAKQVRLNGEMYAVVGVLPASFTFRTANTEFAVPLVADGNPYRYVRNSTSFLRAVGRLRPGITAEQAKPNLDAVAAELRRAAPSNSLIVGIEAIPMREEITGGSRPMLLMLLGAVGFVLLIACTNISSLLIAKAAGRRKEMAIRAALGGSRWRLGRQLILESLMLAIAGGMLGVMLALWGVPLLLALSPAELPRAREVHLDGTVLAVGLGVSLLCGLVLGSMPALQVFQRDLHETLRGAGRSATSTKSRSRLRSTLVVVEVALSLTLLTGAGLVMKSFHRLTSIDPGFQTVNLETLRLALPATRYRTADAVWNFHEKLRDRVAALPGVTAVGSISILPLSGPIGAADFTIDGQPPVTEREKPTSQYRMIDSTYFGTMRVPIVRGRNFTEHDTAQSGAVVIVSEVLAKTYWKDRDPVGSHIHLEDNSGAPRDVEVVGVAGSVREMALDKPATPTLFVPQTQVPKDLVRFLTNNFFWAVRTQSNSSVAQAVRQEIRAVDGDVAATDALMGQYLEKALAPQKFSLRILTAFALAALLLAATGLYALVSYATAQRTREFGIRLAMGARFGNVAGMVLRQGLALALLGVALGTAAAYGVGRYLQSQLFEVSGHDGTTMAAAGFLMIALAAAASFVPARRAAKVDPVDALRGE